MNNQEKTIKFFKELSFENIDSVNNFYHPKCDFIDPLTKISGIEEIKNYYKNLYKSVNSIRFEFTDFISEKEKLAAYWTMYLSAKGIKNGQEISVAGCSHIKFENNLAIYHRDYYDMGEFVYEHISILNKIIFYIKRRLKSK